MKLRQMLGNRTINYDKYANGIYILHTNGLLFKRDKWNLPNDEAVGVAVISDNCKFVIAPDECMDYIRWGPYQQWHWSPARQLQRIWMWPYKTMKAFGTPMHMLHILEAK